MNKISYSGTKLLRHQVYEYLRRELRSERLQPGSYIRVNELSEELKISRTPLRDALLQLQSDGFVTFLPQRGILINELTDHDIGNIYEMLGALDSRGLIAVFSKIGENEIEQMIKINQEMLLQVENEAYYEYFDLNTEFHNVYLNFSSNSILLEQLNILRQRLFGFSTRGEWIKKVQVLNYQEHLKLIELIKCGDAHAAADFIRDVHCSTNW